MRTHTLNSLFVLVGFLCIASVSGQNSRRLDSLLQAHKTQQDTTLAITLNEIAWEFKNSNLDSSFYYANKALAVSKKLKSKKWIASAYNSLANCFDSQGLLDSAAAYHKKSLALKLEIGEVVGAADTYNNLGILYDLKGEFKKSLEYYFKALKIYESEDLSYQKVPMVLGNIGIVYKKQKEYDKVISYYQRALKIYEDNNYDFGTVVTKGNLGSVYIHLKDFEKAIRYSEEAKDLYAKLGYGRYVPYMLTNIGIAKDSLGQNQEAQKIYLEAISLFEKDENRYELTYAQINLARSYLTTGQSKKSRELANQALATCQNKGYKEFEVQTYKLLAEASSQQGLHKQAFDYFGQYAQGKDSLFEKNKTKAILELETSYETEKKEKEIQSQRAILAENALEINKKDTQLAWLGFGLLFLMVIGYVIYHQQQLKTRQLLHEQQMTEAMAHIQTQNKLQDQRLRISRDLHDNIGAQLTFIISSLDSLNYGLKDEQGELTGKIDRISGFSRDTIVELRDTIWAMNKEEITLEDLQERISNFVEKANLSANRIKFTQKVSSQATDPKPLSSSVGMNLYRIIQEALNNALKHAEPTHVELHITERDSSLKIVVMDDGQGFDTSQRTSGNGLNNMRKRAEEIGAELSLDAEPSKGTQLVVEYHVS